MPYYPPPSSSSGSYLPLSGGTMTGTITSTIGTIVANTPALSATQEWNAAGTTFQGIFLNVTATAAAAASMLLDIQLAGATKFRVDSTGQVRSSGMFVFAGSVGMQDSLNTYNVVSGNVNLSNAGFINFSSDGSFARAGAKDVALKRSVAGMIEINSTVAGTYRDLKLRDIYINGATYLLRASAALADNSGANTATLTNAPVSGNPTKWAAVDDNGTTRYQPLW